MASVSIGHGNYSVRGSMKRRANTIVVGEHASRVGRVHDPEPERLLVAIKADKALTGVFRCVSPHLSYLF